MIDFHNHFVGRLPSEASQRWPMLADSGALELSLERVEARVLSTPLEFARNLPVQRINDAMADVVRGDGRLYGLASVDAYTGDVAATELSRAVTALGLRGVFMESAKGELLPDCSQTQPVLAAAASLEVPVFLHPVPDRGLKARFADERLVRSTINSAAILAMIGSGVFEKHRGLKVVVTALALGGLLLADRIPQGIYIDTTGMKPAMIRGAIELLGAQRVVAGTDWPVVQEPAGRLASLPEPLATENARELLRL